METEEPPEVPVVEEECPPESEVSDNDVISPAQPEEDSVVEPREVDSPPPSALKNETGVSGEKRMPKNVSFEDVESLTNGSSEKDSRDTSAKDNNTEGSRTYSSRKKLRQESEQSKREVKHREHRKSRKKSSSLFGPEGKGYSVGSSRLDF